LHLYIRSLASVVETSLTDGGSVHSFVGTAVAGNQVAAAQGLTWTFASGVTMSGGTYNVGAIDFIALGQASADFTEADGTDLYKIGTITNTVGTESYVMYQIAGIKGGADAQLSVVKGNYIFTGSDTQGLVSASDGTAALVDSTAPDGSSM